MNFDWSVIREKALEGFSKFSQLVVFQLVCFYLLGCVVAVKPIGPKGYVTFAYHCFQWHPAARPAATQTALKKEVTRGQR